MSESYYNQNDYRETEMILLAIKFDEQQRAEGLRELILHGDVYCLPNHIFIVPLNSLHFLDKASISYTSVDGKMKNARSRKTKPLAATSR